MAASGRSCDHVAGTLRIKPRYLGTDSPLGTLAIHVTGSFPIGLLMTLFTERFQPHTNLRLLLVVGSPGRTPRFPVSNGGALPRLLGRGGPFTGWAWQLGGGGLQFRTALGDAQLVIRGVPRSPNGTSA